MSSRRSRSGGRWISIVFSRNSRSSRNRPAATSAAGRRWSPRSRAHRRVASSTTRRARTRRSAARAAAWPAARAARSPISSRKQRAAVRQLEAADAIGLRVGERALHVPEQLALEHALGQSADVDRDERRGARGDAACSHCATTSLPVPCSPVISTLASDGADPLHQLKHRPHRRRFGDHLRERRRGAAAGSPSRAAGLAAARGRARPASRRMESSRALSQGFST